MSQCFIMSIPLNFLFKMAFAFCYLQLFETKKIGKPSRKLQSVCLYYLDSLIRVVRDCFRRRQRSERLNSTSDVQGPAVDTHTHTLL